MKKPVKTIAQLQKELAYHKAVNQELMEKLNVPILKKGEPICVDKRDINLNDINIGVLNSNDFVNSINSNLRDKIKELTGKENNSNPVTSICEDGFIGNLYYNTQMVSEKLCATTELLATLFKTI